MKKDFVIEMEEECITCPMLSLETTDSVYAENKVIYKVHQCEHLEFCKVVRKNWEMYHNEERKES